VFFIVGGVLGALLIVGIIVLLVWSSKARKSDIKQIHAPQTVTPEFKNPAYMGAHTSRGAPFDSNENYLIAGDQL
jgi:hypothetical protein